MNINILKGTKANAKGYKLYDSFQVMFKVGFGKTGYEMLYHH